jgi:uncharacterized metal-binding protein YceD (DUF177 family)
VSQNNDYILTLKTLPQTETIFEFKLDNKFFAQHEYIDICGCSVDAKIVAKKRIADIELSFELKGFVTVICDRCLEEMNLPIKYQETVLVKFGKSFDDSEDIIVIDENEGAFDVAWLLYEMVAAAVPPQHSHPFEKCNKEMIEVYNKYIVSDNNDDSFGD